jgi:hypothetical protein
MPRKPRAADPAQDETAPPVGQPKIQPTAADQVLYGAEAIGDFIGANKHRTFFLLEKGALPAFKIGRIWCMRPSAWRAWCAAQEAKQAGEAA